VFGVFCRRFGVPLVDGGTVRLPRLIGQSHAMDMILTGRPVEADEAHRIGLANRVCEPGEALEAAVELAGRIAAFPQACLRNDRRSALEQWSMPESGALLNETRRGLDTLSSGETAEGAARFSGGEGRHGAF
jgi:enoyl-CoA hydratase